MRTSAVKAMALLGVLVVAGLLLWGSGSGEPLVGEPSVRLPEGSSEFDDAAATADPESLPSQEGTDPPEDGSGVNIALIVQVVLAAVIAWFVVRWFRNREARGPTEFVNEEPPDELNVLVEATSANAATAATRNGEPRNAVVACWVALEDALARAGAAPMPGETSWDLTQRVLSRWQVDPAPLSDLADLFREARFSRHMITQAHADRAADALSQIHRGLVRAAAARDSSRPHSSPSQSQSTADADETEMS